MSNMQSLAQKHRVSNVPTEYSGSVDFDIPRKTSTSSVGERRRSMQFSTSPEQALDAEGEEPTTVSEVRTAEDRAEPIDTSIWDTRLQEIERRQARIEGLLERIAARI
jgi:hypothetical protein